MPSRMSLMLAVTPRCTSSRIVATVEAGLEHLLPCDRLKAPAEPPGAVPAEGSGRWAVYYEHDLPVVLSHGRRGGTG